MPPSSSRQSKMAVNSSPTSRLKVSESRKMAEKTSGALVVSGEGEECGIREDSSDVKRRDEDEEEEEEEGKYSDEKYGLRRKVDEEVSKVAKDSKRRKIKIEDKSISLKSDDLKEAKVDELQSSKEEVITKKRRKSMGEGLSVEAHRTDSFAVWERDDPERVAAAKSLGGTEQNYSRRQKNASELLRGKSCAVNWNTATHKFAVPKFYNEAQSEIYLPSSTPLHSFSSVLVTVSITVTINLTRQYSIDLKGKLGDLVVWNEVVEEGSTHVKTRSSVTKSGYERLKKLGEAVCRCEEERAERRS